MLIGGICPSTEIWGGVRRYFEMGNCFVDRGHTYHFIYKYKTRSPWINFKGTLVPITDIKKYKYDIIFTGAHESFPDLLGALAETKVVLVVSNFYTDKYIELYNKGAADYLWIGVSHNWQSQFIKQGITGFSCPGGVNTRFFIPDFSLRSKEIVRISFYGQQYDRSERARQALDYINVETEIKKLNGLYKDRLEFIAFNSSNVKYSYPIKIQINRNQEELRKLLQSSHLVISAKRKGCWDNVVAEAFACGTPVVSYFDGTVNLMRDGITGKLVNEDYSISEAVCWFMEDRSRLRQCGKEARKLIENYSWENYTDRFLKIVKTYADKR